MKRLLLFLPYIVLFAAALVTGALFRYPLVTDDPFITYRYAQNLLAGNGMVFNAGERVLSTTTPLYALLLAALGLVYRDLPRLGYWGSVVSYGVAAGVLYWIGARAKFRMGGFLAGLFLLTAPALVMTFGLETGFYVMLALAAFALYVAGRVTWAFAAAALLTLTRNDGILVAALLGGHYLWSERAQLRAGAAGLRGARDTRQQGGRKLLRLAAPFLIYALILLPWLIFAWLYFGAPFPFTLAAKIAQAQSGLWDPFAVGLGKWARDNPLWLGPLGLFGAVGLIWAARARSLLLLIAAWAGLHAAAYALLGVAFYPWYAAPIIPALALFAGVGIEVSARWLARHIFKPDGGTRAQWFTAGVCALVGLGMAALLVQQDVNAGMTKPSPKVATYTRAADWLAQNTPLDATVDALEVGVIGFRDNRKTYDFVGLVDPAQVPYLRTREFANGVRRRAADYVVAIPPDSWLPNDVWFKDAYQPVQQFRFSGLYNNRPLVIYQRVGAGQSPAETQPVGGAFEKRIGLDTVDVYANEVKRGTALPLRLNLQLRDSQPIPETWKFTLQLVGENDRVVAQTDNFFPLRLPADQSPFQDLQAIPIGKNAPPGTYNLVLAMYDAKTGERLTRYDAQGNDAGDFVNLGQVTITP